ncbi:MAG: hydroxymethylglutaryl-CoA reductase, degradative [Myxococcota bacterium]
MAFHEGGFYRLPLDERRRRLASLLEVTEADVQDALGDGGLREDAADALIENVVGRFALPFAVARHFVVNGNNTIVPMAIEEPSVVAAASAAAKLLRSFATESTAPLAIAQVYLEGARTAVDDNTEVLDVAPILARADQSISNVVVRGGGAREVEVSKVGEFVRVHVYLDVRDAMGANLADTVAEAVAPLLEKALGGRALLRIVSNLSDRRLTTARVRLPVDVLGRATAASIVKANEIADLDPYRATTHNKGIMNGVDAVALATGNDWRAVEAGAHAYAARSGQYRTLTRWTLDDTHLAGELTLPLSLGIVGGAIRAHRGAQFAIAATGVSTAAELAGVAAAAGLATNFAALRALVTTGIQAGHMRLHARSVALQAGAEGHEIDTLAERLSGAGEFTLERARSLLETLRAEPSEAER